MYCTIHGQGDAPLGGGGGFWGFFLPCASLNFLCLACENVSLIRKKSLFTVLLSLIKVKNQWSRCN